MGTVRRSFLKPGQRALFRVILHPNALSCTRSTLARQRERPLAGAASMNQPVKWPPAHPAWTSCSERRSSARSEPHVDTGPLAAQTALNDAPCQPPDNRVFALPHMERACSVSYVAGMKASSWSHLLSGAIWCYLPPLPNASRCSQLVSSSYSNVDPRTPCMRLRSFV